MASYEQQYLAHMQALLSAAPKQDRTGTGTVSIFGHQIRHDLREGFPLLTTKKVFLKAVIHELLWFIKGDTNITYLQDNGVTIWDEWADENGNLGPIYGAMWRNWEGASSGVFWVDQLAEVIAELRRNPTSRRLIVSAWNPALLPDPSLKPHENATRGLQALPPCHTLWQLNAQEISVGERWDIALKRLTKEQLDEVLRSPSPYALLSDFGIPKYHLDLQLYQRSADWFLGVPFNVASYSLLLMMIAKITNMVPRYFIHSFGDTHLYLNHIEQTKEQLSRSPLPMPSIVINGEQETIDDFKFEDFELVGYQHHPAIKAPVSV